jgi:hypothetical protein
MNKQILECRKTDYSRFKQWDKIINDQNLYKVFINLGCTKHVKVAVFVLPSFYKNKVIPAANKVCHFLAVIKTVDLSDYLQSINDQFFTQN